MLQLEVNNQKNKEQSEGKVSWSRIKFSQREYRKQKETTKESFDAALNYPVLRSNKSTYNVKFLYARHIIFSRLQDATGTTGICVEG